MEKLFDKLPYDDLEGIQFTHLLAGAVGMGLLLFAAYFFTLYSATTAEFEKLTKQKKEAQRTLKRYQATVAKEGLVAKNLSRVKGQFNAYKTQMPSQNEIPDLMRRIAAFGKHRNIKMLSLTLEEGALGDFYKEIPLRIQISGELWVALDFIEYVQNLLRLVSFDDLSLQAHAVKVAGAPAREASIGSLNMTVTAKTYSFLEGSENRLPEQPKPPNKPAATNKKGH